MNEKYIDIEWLEGTIPTIITIPNNFNNTLVLMLHAHASEKNESGFYTNLAQELANKGIMSARFDFIGCGDSKIPFKRNSIYNMSLCVKEVYDYITNNYDINKNNTTLLGFSMGARVALHCIDFINPNSLVLLSPAIENGDDMLKKIFGDDYLDKYEIAKEKYEFTYVDKSNNTLTVGPSFFKDIRLSNPSLVIKYYTNNLSVIYPENDQIINPNIQKEFINHAINAKNKNVVMINNATHNMNIGAKDKTIENHVLSVVYNEIINNLK